MTFKLNALVTTLVMVASAPAFAAISNGADGNGELFFTMWDSTNSYSRDLNITINDFETSLAGSGPLNLSFAADSTFTSFLSTANSAELQWNVVASDAQGARRFLQTFTAPKPTTTKPNDSIRTGIGFTQSFVNDLNLKLSCGSSLINCNPAPGVDSATYAVGTPGYGDDAKFGDDANGYLNFKNTGNSGTNSAATGLSFMRINAAATGIAASTYTPYLDSGNDVKVYLDSSNALHIAAVPEAETYAMMLAGLGLVGFMVRRRNHFA